MIFIHQKREALTEEPEKHGIMLTTGSKKRTKPRENPKHKHVTLTMFSSVAMTYKLYLHEFLDNEMIFLKLYVQNHSYS